MMIKIKVLKEDIEKGIPDDCQECAISQALKRHFNTNDVCTSYNLVKEKTFIEVNGKIFKIKKSDDKIVGDFIDKFDNYVDFKYLKLDDEFLVDNNLIPKPFEFEIYK